MAQDIFKRVEVKYLLNEDQYLRFREINSDKIIEDEYGLSKISSIYFDTNGYDLIRESLEKPVYKEKLRLRGYGDINENSPLYLELKKKYDGIVYKRRIKLGYTEAMDYLYKNIPPKHDSQILREIDYFIKYYRPEKSTYISYDRIATYGKEDKELRITFDKNIHVAFDRNNLINGEEGKTIIPDGYRLMEIKVSGAMPKWLTDSLSELNIYPTSFSKYGKACKDYLEYGKCAIESNYVTPFLTITKYA